MTREIWRCNRNEELMLMEDCLVYYPLIAIDTEFPGSLRKTSINATEEERYDDMSFSVDRTKLIQLGLTLFDSNGRIGGTWEINFCDFGETEDARNEKSMEFLKRNGLDLEKIREQGIRIGGFFSDLSSILNRRKNITWVTFHGSYDIAYLIKYFTRKSLPATSERFAKSVARVMGSVYDLKAMAGQYKGLSSKLGLESLAHELGVYRVGTAHHAGSDSQLTAQVFSRMAQIFHNVRESEGFVYGLGCRIISKRLKQEVVMMHNHHREMMTRCYGPPPPLAMALLQRQQLRPRPRPRPMFVPSFPPFGRFVMLPRVSLC